MTNRRWLLASGILATAIIAALGGCNTGSRIESKSVSFPNSVEPVWSMHVGCEGGFRIVNGKILLRHQMFRDQYYQWVLDTSDGAEIAQSEGPVGRMDQPSDTVVEIRNGRVLPLQRSAVEQHVPAGFSPIVVTDQFVFAKKTTLGFSFPRFIHYGQMAVIDRASGKQVWLLDGTDATVQASASQVFVCNSKVIAAFTPQAGRPKEITQFYAAVRDGDADSARKLLPSWRRSPLYDLDGHEPLTVAARAGKVEIVRFLLGAGLSPNSKCADGYSPLLMALNWEHPTIVELLLASGADPNYDGRHWQYPLTDAVHAARKPLIDLLLAKGAKLDAVEQWSGRTALHEAVMYRNYEAVQALLDAGSKPTAKDKDGNTPPQLAEFDKCIQHLFRGGRIKDQPRACAPVVRETVGLETKPSNMWR